MSEAEPTGNVYFTNERLVMCPACIGPLYSFAWNRFLRGEDVDVYELTAHCANCNRWFTVGYSREPHERTSEVLGSHDR